VQNALSVDVPARGWSVEYLQAGECHGSVMQTAMKSEKARTKTEKRLKKEGESASEST
jgi:hypothetical protein